MENPQDLEQSLNALQQKFKDSLPKRLDDISVQWNKVLTSAENIVDNIGELHRCIHSITGSAGIFGADKVGNDARNLELVVKTITERDSLPNPEEQTKINQLLDTLIATGTTWNP